MRTYVVLITRLGRTRRLEIWASSPWDAQRKAQAMHPDATITSVEVRKAF